VLSFDVEGEGGPSHSIYILFISRLSHACCHLSYCRSFFFVFFDGLSGDFVLIYRSFIDHNVVRTDTHRFALLISEHAFSLFCCRLLQSLAAATIL